MKISEAAISFILEDFVESGLQYFYFEKFQFLPSDTFVIFNSVFMVLKALEITIRTIMYMKEDNWRIVGDHGPEDPGVEENHESF